MPQESLGVVTAALKRAYDFRLEALRVRKMDRKRLQYECTTFTINFLADQFIIPADTVIDQKEKQINLLEQDIKFHLTLGDYHQAGLLQTQEEKVQTSLAKEQEFLKRHQDVLTAVVDMSKMEAVWWLQKGDDEVVPPTTATVVSAWNVRVSNEHNQKASQYSTLCAETGLVDVYDALEMKREQQKKVNTGLIAAHQALNKNPRGREAPEGRKCPGR